MVSSEGAMFLSAIDTSGKEKNAQYIAEMLEVQIEKIGMLIEIFRDLNFIFWCF